MGQKIRYEKPMLMEITSIQSAAAACSPVGSCEVGVQCEGGSKVSRCNAGEYTTGNCSWCNTGGGVQVTIKWGGQGCGGGTRATDSCGTGSTTGKSCGAGTTVLICTCS